MSQHPYYSKLQEQLVEGRLDRREFVRYASLLGVSATSAYAFAGKIVGEDFAPRAQAQDMPMGGTMFIAMRCTVIQDPHTFAWVIDSNIVRQVCGYLSRTGTDNVTRPDLLEGWEASDDLATWTLKVRQGVNWHDGRPFTAFHQGFSLIAGMKKGHQQVDHIAFEVDDVRRLRERLKARGCHFQDDLHNGPYGLTIYVSDPDGNRIELYQVGAKA